MGRLLLIAVIALGVLFSTLVLKMNKQAVKLPQVLVSEVSSKETQNLSNYAIRYALQFATSQHFPATVGFTKKQSFNNFFYRYGYIDSIRYDYAPTTNNFLIKAYTRTTIAGKQATHLSKAAIRGISTIGGKGDIAHWSFENNFLDSSANHNNGSGYGGIRFVSTGMNAYCVIPDGNDDYVNVPDSPSLDLPNQFSIALWVNWVSTTGYQPLVWKPQARIYSKCYEDDNPSWGLWTYGNKVYGQVTRPDQTFLKVVTPSTVSSGGTWHLVTMTYGQGALKLYYDGVLKATATGSTPQPLVTTWPVTIARMDPPMCGGYDYTKGRLDEIGIYSMLFTPAQVTSIWNSSNGLLPYTTGTPAVDYVRE